MMNTSKEGDLLLDMFQTEFKKMHSDLLEKEVRLFHHIFHHLFSSRLAKLEQFLHIQYQDFQYFEPEYAPLNPSSKKRPPPPPEPEPEPVVGGTMKEEVEEVDTKYFYMDDDDQEEEEETAPFITDLDSHHLQQGNPLHDVDDMDNFIPIHDSDDDHDEGDGDDQTAGENGSSRTTAATKLSPPPPRPHRPTPGKGGRKRNPIWECYSTTFSNNGKVFTNECRQCGQQVSPKAWRMQLHALKCKEQPQINGHSSSSSSFKMSLQTERQLKRFQAQQQLEKQEIAMHKEGRKLRNQNSRTSVPKTNPATPTITIQVEEISRNEGNANQHSQPTTLSQPQPQPSLNGGPHQQYQPSASLSCPQILRTRPPVPTLQPMYD